jgi:hypothetical protein
MKGKVSMSGKLKIKKIRSKKEGMIKMLLNKIKPLAQKFGLMLPKKHIVEMYGSLAVKKISADGDTFDYGVVSRGKVTDVFVNYLVDCMQAQSTGINRFRWHHSGSATAAENKTDTQLSSGGLFLRDYGTSTEGASANIYRSIATHTYTTGAVTIVEHGIFATSSSGEALDALLDRHIFAPISCSSGDSIQFTYELTATAEA